MKVLVLGASGMLGYSVFKNLSDYKHYKVFGTVRSIDGIESYFSVNSDNLIFNVDVTNFAFMAKVFEEVAPDVVINCIGLIKQNNMSKQYIDAIYINSLLPHKLAKLCSDNNAKLIHFSTDCVFDGKRGGYVEEDLPNATDIYGKAKCLGEIDYSPHLTLRTSIIGHELKSSVSLIDWFLKQNTKVSGFSKAIFSGLPTSAIAHLLANSILPNTNLNGLFHLSADPIDKYSLLQLVANVYGKQIEIDKSPEFVIDRSLSSKKLQNTIDIKPHNWGDLIKMMHEDYLLRYGK